MKRVKKVRGLRRRKAHIESWVRESASLDLDALARHYYRSQKIHIHPWSNLFHYQQPPSGYRNSITQGLLHIMSSWHAALRNFPQEYRLQLWLYHPRFMESQIVVATGERLHFYDSVFHPAILSTVFPLEYFHAAMSELSQLSWKAYDDELSYSESDLLHPISYYDDVRYYYEDRRLLRKLQTKHLRSYTVDIEGMNDTYYTRRMGDVWIAQLSNTDESQF